MQSGSVALCQRFLGIDRGDKVGNHGWVAGHVQCQRRSGWCWCTAH